MSVYIIIAKANLPVLQGKVTCSWCKKQQKDGKDSAPRVRDEQGHFWHLGGASGWAYTCTAKEKKHGSKGSSAISRKAS